MLRGIIKDKKTEPFNSISGKNSDNIITKNGMNTAIIAVITTKMVITTMDSIITPITTNIRTAEIITIEDIIITVEIILSRTATATAALNVKFIIYSADIKIG